MTALTGEDVIVNCIEDVYKYLIPRPERTKPIYNFEVGSLGYYIEKDMVGDVIKKHMEISTDMLINKHNLLELSALCGSINCFKYFLKSGFEIDTDVAKSAIEGDNYDIIAICADLVDFKDVFDFAIENGCDHIVQWILYNCDVDINLHRVAKGGNIAWLLYLLYNGEDIESKDADGWTPLFYATLNNKFDIVKILVERGANVNTTDNEGSTPLIEACCEDNINIVSYLLEHNADVNAVNSLNRTALHNAVSIGSYRIVELLLKYDPDINFPNEYGASPLLIAAEKGFPDIALLLIESGADRNTKDDFGFDIREFAEGHIKENHFFSDEFKKLIEICC